MQNISEKELNQVKKLKKSINEFKTFGKLRNIKNIEKLTKEDLINTLLKSESSIAERNFEKLFNNSNTDNDTYDNQIRSKISDIRMILNRLGNIVTKEDKKDIKKKLHGIR